MTQIQNLICPVCSTPITKYDKFYKCKNNHSFDIAKEGYSNFMLPNKKSSKNPGDSKEMVISRYNFLSKGHYEPLAAELSNLTNVFASSLPVKNFCAIDAGCGEGYYTEYISGRLPENIFPSFLGIDVSKEAMKIAAKRTRLVTFITASSHYIPIESHSADIAYSIFAPYIEKEFERILKPDGILAIVSPGANHLFGLKSALYAAPYKNDETKPEMGLFSLFEEKRVSTTFTVTGRDDILDLIRMTPYYWNTSMSKIEETLSTYDTITTEAEFIISLYKKK